MKRLVALFVLLGTILATPSYAAGATAEPSLWDRLRQKIEVMTPKKKLSASTAAGGVRGSLVDADDVYWKGEFKPQTIDPDELSAFKKAITLGDAGKTADTQAAFSEFIMNYPESNLRADAEAALAQLQTTK
jgi:TolA-binding protein